MPTSILCHLESKWSLYICNICFHRVICWNDRRCHCAGCRLLTKLNFLVTSMSDFNPNNDATFQTILILNYFVTELRLIKGICGFELSYIDNVFSTELTKRYATFLRMSFVQISIIKIGDTWKCPINSAAFILFTVQYYFRFKSGKLKMTRVQSLSLKLSTHPSLNGARFNSVIVYWKKKATVLCKSRCHV